MAGVVIKDWAVKTFIYLGMGAGAGWVVHPGEVSGSSQGADI